MSADGMGCKHWLYKWCLAVQGFAAQKTDANKQFPLQMKTPMYQKRVNIITCHSGNVVDLIWQLNYTVATAMDAKRSTPLALLQPALEDMHMITISPRTITTYPRSRYGGNSRHIRTVGDGHRHRGFRLQ